MAGAGADPAPALESEGFANLNQGVHSPREALPVLCVVEGCQRTQHARTPAGPLCNLHYKRWHRAQPKCSVLGCLGTPFFGGTCRRHEPTLINDDGNLGAVVERFAQNLVAYAGCWEWTGTGKREGYGLFSAHGHKWNVHRWAYGYFNGAHTTREELDHVCGVKLCVRPDHLFPVGCRENVRLRERRAAMPDAWITPRRYRRVWTPRADEFAIEHRLPAPAYDLAA